MTAHDHAHHDASIQVTLWAEPPAGGAAESIPLRGPRALPFGAAADAATLIPVRTRHGSAAVLLVPDALAGTVAVGGVRLRGGAHIVRHAERISGDGAACWLSTVSDPVTARYDPERDGADRFCARTKARLAPGDPVVVCPGTPAASCGELYREQAWFGELPCHVCGRDPRLPGFVPPAPRAASAAPRLFALARRRARSLIALPQRVEVRRDG